MKDFIKCDDTALLILDMQEKLLPHIEHGPDILEALIFITKAFQLLDIPIFVSEQYPEGLGKTSMSLQKELKNKSHIFEKRAFSAYFDPNIKRHIDAGKKKSLILGGVEAHICVLQTAKDLLLAGYDVIILNDGTSSRSIYDFSTALGELRDMGARISCTEAIVYELVRDSNHPKFKDLLQIIKNRCLSCSS